MTKNTGRIVGVNGNLLTVEFDSPVIQNEVGYAHLGETRLKSEVIRIRGRYAELQVFEDTTGLQVGNAVDFTGELPIRYQLHFSASTARSEGQMFPVMCRQHSVTL